MEISSLGRWMIPEEHEKVCHCSPAPVPHAQKRITTSAFWPRLPHQAHWAPNPKVQKMTIPSLCSSFDWIGHVLRRCWVQHETNQMKTPTIDIHHACLNSLVWRLKSRKLRRRMEHHSGPAESTQIQQHQTRNTGSDRERDLHAQERKRERERERSSGRDGERRRASKRERERDRARERARESERARARERAREREQESKRAREGGSHGPSLPTRSFWSPAPAAPAFEVTVEG